MAREDKSKQVERPEMSRVGREGGGRGVTLWGGGIAMRMALDAGEGGVERGVEVVVQEEGGWRSLSVRRDPSHALRQILLAGGGAGRRGSGTLLTLLASLSLLLRRCCVCGLLSLTSEISHIPHYSCMSTLCVMYE